MPPFLPSGLGPGPRSRRSRPDQVDYWEGALQLLCNKRCLKMIDHGSRNTWGPGPSRSGLGSQKYDPPPTKMVLPCNFCFIKFLPSLTVEAVDAPSSSRGVFPSDLHSYSKRRFIRPFAPPCSPWLSPSFLAWGWGGSRGGGAGRKLSGNWGKGRLKFFNNSIVQALVVVVIVV
jgi:hypothetical protein